MIRLLTHLAVALALLISSELHADAQQCQTDNPSLQAMPTVRVQLLRADGSRYELDARLADNDVTRAAGFQRVCESAIKLKPILFEFKRPVTPRFHMHNVVAPIDIAFIDKNGQVDSIRLMTPYVLGAKDKPLYGPDQPIVAALEVHQGFFTEHNIDLTSKIEWHHLAADHH